MPERKSRMTEYIEREALIEKCHWVIRSDGIRVYVCHAEDIETAPAADVAPVRHGRWIKEIWLSGTHKLICRECGKWGSKRSNYCPNCGAKMDLED